MSIRRRGNSYQIDINQGKGGRHFCTLPMKIYTYEDAIEIEKGLRKELGAEKATVKRDINAVYAQYLQWVELQQSPATLRLKRYLLLSHILPFFGTLTPERITDGLIVAYKQKRKQEVISAVSKGNARMINLELLTLRHLCKQMFNQRIAAELLPDKRALPVPLTPDEVTRFMDALEPKYKLLFLLMYQTGIRKSEALNLTWQDVHGNNVTIKGKGGTWRSLPISNALVAELAKIAAANGVMSASTERPIFPGKPMKDGTIKQMVNIYKAIARARRKAGIKKRIYPHLLRHSMATTLMDASGDLRGIQEILGHRSSKTTEIYTQISMEHKRSLLDIVNGGEK